MEEPEPVVQTTVDNSLLNQVSEISIDWSSEDDDDRDYADWDWEDETGDFTKKYNSVKSPNSQSNPNQQISHRRNQPNEKAFGKYASKIHVEKYDGPRLSSSAVSSLLSSDKRTEAGRSRVKDKADRATMEQVLDPRTRMILFKMLNRHVISEISGCISTGKEANVYHASTKEGNDMAVKVYKTSILVFKDRDKYVTGEFRFRHGYCKHNPRKMVQTWAEKEMRNLTRMYNAGIPCPQPVILRSHVLVMSFIGTQGWPAPKLKDVELSESKARELYLSCIQLIRKIYQDCKLVHADLSEYNMLYHEGDVFLIDVSQSVEHDHPQALEFLRKDCTNITDYFRKNGVSVMSVRELFDFVTDSAIHRENIDQYLSKAMEIAINRTEEDVTEEQKMEEEVFKQSYIPRTMDEITDFEQDVKKVQEGQSDQVYYQAVIGMKTDLTGAQQQPKLLEDESSTDDSEEDDNSNDEDDEKSKYKRQLHRDESPNSRRIRKQAVKEAQREKRKNKTPKFVKKRKEKLARQKKGKN
ncbi:serine/threonine-protein kinase RIO1-like [Saccoglossus kowalevskii]|uniref:Serine/threonine-protein kinase RIO1 n=1 Tax=Saccoglossus kowalevskii TaxID=10224 RepID=A0ABM0MTC5_SACKO|nr:PREDICTED: serine/threonine-protein kinase RIO1-like [Saccoglossus kowalevskii]